ncbi:hypothetical protein [Nonomuraea sp. GTA35]
MLEFVYGADAQDLPRRTCLERAVADCITAGGTPHGRVGWLPFTG